MTKLSTTLLALLLATGQALGAAQAATVTATKTSKLHIAGRGAALLVGCAGIFFTGVGLRETGGPRSYVNAMLNREHFCRTSMGDYQPRASGSIPPIARVIFSLVPLAATLPTYYAFTGCAPFSGLLTRLTNRR